jgi:hypothetical protein
MGIRPTTLSCIVIASGVALQLGGARMATASDDPGLARFEFFERRVRPLLADRCYECHSASAAEPKGGLRLDTRSGMVKGGSRGPAIVPGDADQSLIVNAIRYQSEDLQMPPKAMLTADEIDAIVAWINSGAPDPRTDATATSGPNSMNRELDERQRWVFQPPAEPSVPAVKNHEWPRGDVDRFILAKLEERGLAPARDADKRTLIRRATFDLIGLPPTPEEIDAFLADESPDAFARLVDRLLASPHYGERWGRFWLDLVRYADTAGDNSDYPVPQLYKYRDWVMDALNRDMPYDEFIRQQLAGDLMPSASDDEKYAKIIATGYIASARRFGSVVDDYPQHLTIEDTIDNLGRTFLGLSINCARCHDHKFDPITSEDYYGLYGFFSSTRYPWPGIELDKVQRDFVPLVPPAEVAAMTRERGAKKAEFDSEVKRLESEKAAADKERREAEQAKRGAEHAKPDDTPDLSTFDARIGDARKRVEELDKAIKDAKKRREEFEKSPLPFETAYAVAEGKQIGHARMQIRGDPKKLGDEVPRRFPKIFGGQLLSAGERGSGRRELASWIADPANPLTARVKVNRIWQHHFGHGIVPTPSDFGRQGRAATHPELLDYLARRFVESGWSVKATHRLIMLSRTYQLSSHDEELNERNAAIDPANVYLWRFNRRRLDAESIRDAMLAVSGQLDRTRGGPHPFPPQTSWDFTQHKPFKAVYETNHRSVFLMTQRIQRHPYLATFDGPDTNASTAGRVSSTTPLQALYLMNDAFVHEQAAQFAARLLASATDDHARLELAYVLAFGRPPTGDDQSATASFLQQLRARFATTGAGAEVVEQSAWQGCARVIFRMNEFVYVD